MREREEWRRRGRRRKARVARLAPGSFLWSSGEAMDVPSIR
jgi:hypothetical protein